MPGQHQQTKITPASPGTTGGNVPISDEQEVRALLARGSTKPAVELAKQIHKRFSTPASEALLVDAYAARIRSLLKIGLATEAKALLDLARERYPSAKEKLLDIGVVVASSQNSLDELLAPLNDPALPLERRLAIEAAIKRQVTDLSALAQCPALAADHPLRTGAAALVKAFEAATSGPVTEDALFLPEVSRRGPLAPWKFLVRAIGCFYRNDGAGCAQCLQAIDPDSVPARLVPALRTALVQGPLDCLPPASASLVVQVGGKLESLRKALESVDDALAKNVQHKIIPEIQRTISLCTTACPELLERLRQHLWIIALRLGLPIRRLHAALGGPVLKNAYFWRLFARDMEISDDPLTPRRAVCGKSFGGTRWRRAGSGKTARRQQHSICIWRSLWKMSHAKRVIRWRRFSPLNPATSAIITTTSHRPSGQSQRSMMRRTLTSYFRRNSSSEHVPLIPMRKPSSSGWSGPCKNTTRKPPSGCAHSGARLCRRIAGRSFT